MDLSTDRASSPISSKDTLEEFQRRVRQYLNYGAPEDEIFDFIFENLSQFLPFDRLSIALVEQNQTHVHSHWVRSSPPAVYLAKNYRAALQGSSLQKIIQSQSPRIINDLLEYSARHPQSESTKLAILDKIRSSLTCPLIANGKPVGFLFFSSYKKDTYKNVHIQDFLKISEDLSLVVEHSRLLQGFNENQNKNIGISNVVHDLRSPLAIIQSVLSLIAEEKWYATLDQETKKYFEILARNCRDMFHLIDDISDANLLSRGFFVLDKEEVKLKKYLEDLAEFCRLLASKKEIQVSLETKDLPETAQFDSFRMKQVIVNLVTNAIKFSPPLSKVWLRAELVAPDQLKFSVIDQGQGIPQEEVPLLFHEYSRTSVKPTNGEKSIGLGLSIIKKIVEAHGGQVSVSTKLGAGSKFSVIIPSSTLKPKKETEWSQFI